MLKRILTQCCENPGTFALPQLDKNLNVINAKKLNADNDSKASQVNISLINESDSDQVKDFMLKTFYVEAPIPQVLKLDRQNCPETQKFLNAEMNYFISSKVSLKITSQIMENKLLGVGFSSVWNRDPNYFIIRAPVQEFHNCAAEIAQNFPLHHRHLIWRQLQWLHIYDLSQSFLSQTQKSHLFYLAILYIQPEFRGKLNFIPALMKQISQPNMSVMVQSNFRGFDKQVKQFFHNPILLDGVKYTEEKLILDPKKGRAFAPIDFLDGLNFFGQI